MAQFVLLLIVMKLSTKLDAEKGPKEETKYEAEYEEQEHEGFYTNYMSHLHTQTILSKHYIFEVILF